MIKCPLLLQTLFKPPCLSPEWHCGRGCLGLVECVGESQGLRVQDGQSSVSSVHTLPLSSRLHCRFSTSAFALHRSQPCSYQAPPSSRPPSHVSTPPSGSSKYFPSLLFEASMGHGTSCTNHAGLPWGGRPEMTGVSQTRRNPICTVFIRRYFSCQDSHHQSAAGSKQPVQGALAVDAGAGSWSQQYSARYTEGGGRWRVNSERLTACSGLTWGLAPDT